MSISFSLEAEVDFASVIECRSARAFQRSWCASVARRAITDVLADGGVLGSYRKYNSAIGRLRQLGRWVVMMVRDGP